MRCSVQDYDFTNAVVESHLLVGEQALLSFKKIIKYSLYPDDFGATNMRIAGEAINAYRSMSSDDAGMIELMMYAAESSVHYTLDTYELEDEVYESTGAFFEKVIMLLTSSHKEYLDQYQSRLEELIVATKYSERYSFDFEDFYNKCRII